VDTRIRYLAIVTEQPSKLSHFYQEYFGLKELATNGAGDVSLTEGSFNLSLLKRRDGLGEVGLSHIGLAIGDIREVEARLEEFAPNAALEALDGSPAQGDYRVFDPNGYAVHLSTSAFGVAGDTTDLPGVRHVALCQPRVDDVCAFFVNVFGIRETGHSLQERQDGLPNRFTTDGRINMAILADEGTMRGRGETNVSPDHQKLGLNHFGFGVESYEPIISHMPAEAEASRRLDRPDPNQYRVLDPDSNHIDLRLGQQWARERTPSGTA
jgi:catechol 2,3-dioxygenase-like lactoylglutathione lyase family enzyme